MPRQWFYARNGKKHGPYSTDKIRLLAANGQLKPTDMILRVGTLKWRLASKARGLFDAGEPTPAPDSGPTTVG